MNKKVKFEIGYGLIATVYFVILIILMFFASKGDISDSIVSWGRLIFLIIFIIPIIIRAFVNIVKYFINCFKNIHSCGDPFFDELDDYNRHWGETKEHYQDMINAINFYYKESGKVDTVVGKDLKRLFNRLEYLNRALSTKEHLNTCILSVGLSVCATIFFECSFGEFQNHIWYDILFVFLFLGTVISRYSTLFKGDSNQVYEYELELLKQKIDNAEKEILIDYKREDILLTKRNVLNSLIDKCSSAHGKKREDIVNDIREIEKLNLNIQDTSGLEEIRFKIGKTDREGVLFLDKNKKIINEQYNILYKILYKHELIYEMYNDEKK